MPVPESLIKDIEDSVVESLDLSGQGYNDEDVAKIVVALKKNPRIKKVNLSYNDIGDRGAKLLAEVETLEELDLSNGLSGYDEYSNHVTVVGCGALSKSKLKKLILNNNAIGNEGIIELAKSKTIVELEVSGCDITSVGSRDLLGRNVTLNKIDLSDNDIGDEGLSTLPLNHSLKELNLSSCKITSVGVQFIAENDSLKTINLNSNKIGDKGAQILSKHTATSLSLCSCNIGDDGAAAFGSALTLQTLRLSNNNITALGIINGLTDNPSLVELHLSNNAIDFNEECLKKLMAMKSLTIIIGEDNKLNKEIRTLIEELRKTSALKKLDLTVYGDSLEDSLFVSFNSKKRKKSNGPPAEDLSAMPYLQSPKSPRGL